MKYAFHQAMFGFDAHSMFVEYGHDRTSMTCIPSYCLWLVPGTWEDL